MPGNLFLPFDEATFAARRRAARRVVYEPLVIIAAALAGGIVLDRVAGDWIINRTVAVPMVWWLAAVGAWLTWFACHRMAWQRFACVALLSSVALSGAAWHHWQWNLFPSDELSRFAIDQQEPVAIDAIVIESPRLIVAPTRTPLRAIPINERSRLRLAVTALRDGTNWQPASGECQLMVEGQVTGIHAGDRVRVFAQLRKISPPLNAGEFDFASFARTERELVALATDTWEAISVLESGSRWSITHAIDLVRESWRGRIQAGLDSQAAPVAEAMLLGSRDALPYARKIAYRSTGTAHILVVSGLHLGLLVGAFYFLMRLGLLPRKVALACVLGLVTFYVLLTGAEPPVMRAGVMAALVCLALWHGRRVVSFNSLAAAAIVVLIWNPGELFQTGTQLSFLCVATLIWFGQRLLDRQPTDPLDRLIASSRPLPIRLMQMSREASWFTVAGTIAVWLTALPLVMSQFHLVPIIAIFISLPVYFLVWVALLCGFAWLTLGWAIPILGPALAWCCNWSLESLDTLVQWANELDWGHLWTPGPPLWWVMGTYVLLVALYSARHIDHARRWSFGIACTWVALGFSVPLLRTTPPGLQCSFISVGHGTCVVLQTSDRRTLLYDAGALRAPEDVTSTIAGYLWSRGITRIDGIVLSHADVDHYNAVPELLDHFPVAAIYVTPQMWPRQLSAGDQSGPALLRRQLEARGVPIETLEMGDRLQLGEVSAEVLHPTLLGVLGNDNANSMVLGIEYRGQRILLPGDLEQRGIDFLLSQEPYDCDILLAPHHGSLRSDPPGFAAWSMPEWVVISGNRSAGADEVALRYQLAGARVLHTANSGACEFLLGGNSIEFTPARQTRTQSMPH